MHTIISGIDSLSNDTEKVLSSISTYEYKTIKSKDDLIKAFKSCDIFWFRLNHNITREVLDDSKCRFIICAVTGLDHIDLQACHDKNISIISLKGEFEFLKEIRATAEHTLGLLLALIRQTKRAAIHVEKGHWDRTRFQGSELYKKNVGVLGLGRLGKIMSEYYTVMGMNVFYYDIERQDGFKYVAVNSMEALFKEIDFLSIHLPYNETTHLIINETNLKELKPHVFVVNTSRGGVIDEDAMLVMLKDKRIAGYATDVLFGEPNIDNHPLVSYANNNSNIIITPHIGGNTFESIAKTELFVVKKLKSKLDQF